MGGSRVGSQEKEESRENEKIEENNIHLNAKSIAYIASCNLCNCPFKVGIIVLDVKEK
jgi:hypothetical protein